MAKKNEKALNAYILLDRSGSMANRWEEAISSINAYVDGLAGEKKGIWPASKKIDASVTVALFDDHQGIQYQIIKDHVGLKEWEPIDSAIYKPRGGTPLFDAAMRIFADAKAVDASRTIIVIMTDGQENSSKEATKEMMKKEVEKAKLQGWEVIFLGADFDTYTHTASGLNVAATKTATMHQGQYGDFMRGLSNQTVAYACNATSMDTSLISGKLHGKING